MHRGGIGTLCGSVYDEEHAELIGAVQKQGIGALCFFQSAEGDIGRTGGFAVILTDDEAVNKAGLGHIIQGMRHISGGFVKVSVGVKGFVRHA